MTTQSRAAYQRQWRRDNPEAWAFIQRKSYANRKRGVHAERIVGALHALDCRMPRYCSCRRIVLVRP